MTPHDQLKTLLTGYTPNPGCVASKILEAGFGRTEPAPTCGSCGKPYLMTDGPCPDCAGVPDGWGDGRGSGPGRAPVVPVVPVEAVLGIVQAKADAIRAANTYRGRVSQNAEMSAIFVEDLKDPIRGLIPDGFLLAHGWREGADDGVCPECGHKVSQSHEGVCNNPWHFSATTPPSKAVRDSCGWTRDEWSETWSAGCGAEWIFPDGGPAENDMRFCPSCGKPVALAALAGKGE